MVYKRVSSALFFSIVWMLLVCPKAYSQSNSMRVARIFSDNMVLQQGIYAPVWGWADSGATVRISMSEKEYETVADDTGKWLVKMEPLPAGGPYIECELRWTEGGVQECNDWRGMAGIGAVEYELQGWCCLVCR